MGDCEECLADTFGLYLVRDLVNDKIVTNNLLINPSKFFSSILLNVKIVTNV